MDSIPGLARSPGEGDSNPPQYSCLKNPMDRGAWQATVLHGFRHDWPDLACMHHVPQYSHGSESCCACVFTTSPPWPTAAQVALLSHSVVSDSLWLHELQHTRLSCPLPPPGVYSNSCTLSQWCHPTISSSVVPFSSCISAFSSESVLHIRWPKYWSFTFSISFSNENSGLVSFRMDWFDLLEVQGTLKSLFQHHSSKAQLSLWSN